MTTCEGFITELDPHEVIVVGTNLAGRHGGGAARQAADQFGLAEGVGEGLSGSTYAFPTLRADFTPISSSGLKIARLKFYQCCNANPDKTFLLTKVGCGIAGFSELKMQKLFRNAPANVVKPTDWQVI